VKLDYSEFDATLLALVKSGTRSFTGLSIKMAIAAKPFAEARECPSYRVTDGRLQVLRKHGLLKFDRMNGWTVAEVPHAA
jgi:hypothetical protein